MQVIKYEQGISIRIHVDRCGCCESWRWGVIEGVEEFLENGGEITQIESVFDKTKKLTFEDQMNILLFACYATQSFTVKDIQEAVIDAHRSTVYSQLQNFVDWRYLERVSSNQYRATAYAKDIMNVKGELI